MQQQAIALCKATGYRSAGTVEMLCDGKQNFYFLEMNTRLQVEHPVTELVSGEDLVEHMLWVAAGKALPERLTSKPCLDAKGWALESRVYAEDPLRNFLPTIGPLNTYIEPALHHPETSNGVTVRIDTGVCEGASISMFYDPMISKLCTHAPTRGEAITAMERALDEYFISGLVNNIPFLRSVYRNKHFRNGIYSTKFIPENYPNGFHGVELNREETNKLLATAAVLHAFREKALSQDYEDETGQSFPEYVVVLPGHPASEGHRATHDRPHRVEIHQSDDALVVSITTIGHKGDPETAVVKIASMDWAREDPLAHITFIEEHAHDRKTHDDLDGQSHSNLVVQYEGRGSQTHGIPGAAGETYLLRLLGSQQRVVVRSLAEHGLSRYMLPVAVKDTAKLLLSPMPGTLISCSVHVGQTVEAGQQVAVVEAMKMQNVLRAAKKGVVKAVKAHAGSHLKVDQTIVEFE